jgi:hypothetical protein
VHARGLQEELKSAKDRELAELERISAMTVNEAQAEVLQRSEELVRHELARRVRQMKRKHSPRRDAVPATSSPTRSSESPRAKQPRRPCRSSSFPPTT